jgi:hypothetical protein
MRGEVWYVPNPSLVLLAIEEGGLSERTERLLT